MVGEKGEIKIWSLSIEDLFKHFRSSEAGLTEEEAKKRQLIHGQNEIVKQRKKLVLHLFFSQFKNALVLVLLVAAIISYFLGEEVEAIVIFSIVLLNALLGFFQEYKAEKALRELNKYVVTRAKVLRQGEVKEIDAKELVPGDLVYLSEGDIIPADIRLIHAEDLISNESQLTGESTPIMKKATVISAHYNLPPQLHNLAFMGTNVLGGEGHGLVVKTGMNTFFGQTASFVERDEHIGDFQKNILSFSNFLLKVILVMTLFIFVANAILHKGILISFLFALALAVGITPEVLPVIITITLSKGALQMAREKVVIKKLSSVEDFGNIDTLCCDKTGTLTEGKHTLQNYVDLDGQKNHQLVLYGLLCSSIIGGDHSKKSFGNPIDKAIWESEISRSLLPQLSRYPLLSKNEFDYQRKRMGVAINNKNSNLLIVKGASELVLDVCSFAKKGGKKVNLSPPLIKEIKKEVALYEQTGYKVIAIAEKKISKKIISNHDEKELILLGFLLFLDPAKRTAKDSLEKLQRMGVNIKIISGDSAVVTRKICHDVGLKIVEQKIITGDELEKLSEKELEEYSQKYNVFARVTPQQKFMIVDKLNKEGHIVGYLGDGVNDVPALKAADVGITVDSAVGVAKECADIILLKKSLEVLVDGIIAGRKTFSNITKYILNTISANYGNMFTVAISSLFMSFIPLLPAQILLNNFISDVPNLAISTDNVDERLLKKPKRWNLQLISRFMIYFGLISTFFDLLLIVILMFILKSNMDLFRTAWFVESVLSEIIIVFVIRTALPFWKSKPGGWLLFFSFLAVIIGVMITYLPLGKMFFNFVALPPLILGIIGLVLLAYFSTVEVAKQYFFERFEV